MFIAIAASFALRPVLGVGGLALANAIGVMVEVSTLLLILRHRLHTQSSSTSIATVPILATNEEVVVADRD
jgi:peptidoglycan biosynthesis protein MviN/MurJ (putative lipid II flippase)